MKKILAVSLFLLTSAYCYASAQNKETLKELQSTLDKMNPYGVKVNISYENTSLSGNYEVDKDKYHIKIDEQELYGDSSTKYEVFNNRKEVVIDHVSDNQDGNILNNPATVFSTILRDYTSTAILDNEFETTLELKPASNGDESTESIILTISKSSQLPKQITYKYGDDRIVIDILNIETLTSPITLYDSSKYIDYEVIDFR